LPLTQLIGIANVVDTARGGKFIFEIRGIDGVDTVEELLEAMQKSAVR
jgi:hypothetical protein